MSRTSLLRVSCCIAVLALVLAACGSSDDEVLDTGAEGSTSDAGDGDAAASSDDDGSEVSYPTGSLRFVVPYSPGGSTDLVGREFVRRFEELAGENIVVDNVPGAGGSVGVGEVFAAEPDAHTLGIGVNSALAFQPLVNDDLPWDGADDYTPLASLGYAPQVLWTAADAPWEDYGELLDFVRENPGGISVGGSGAFTISDLLTEQINDIADTEFNMVHLDGASELVPGVIGGHVDVIVNSYPGVRGQYLDGEIRPLVVMDTEPYDALPDTPIITDYIAEMNEPLVFEVFLVTGSMDAPDVVAAIDALVGQVLEDEDFQAWQRDNGIVPRPVTSEGAREVLHSHQGSAGSVIDAMRERGRID